MQVISIKWKDTDDKTYKGVTYRHLNISRYKSGWIIEGLDDNNIYHCIDCALNSIDEQLNGNPRRNTDRRMKHGIHIIGKKVDA